MQNILLVYDWKVTLMSKYYILVSINNVKKVCKWHGIVLISF